MRVKRVCLKMRCKQARELKVLNSHAGYYIGTTDDDGFPYCRVSADYYFNKKKAEEALANKSFREYICDGNAFCNKRLGCL